MLTGMRTRGIWSVLSGPASPGQVARGVDQANMRERLRKVSDHPTRFGIVLLRQQPDVIAQVQKPFEDVSRLVVSALERKIVGKPEGAEQECPFSCRQSVHVWSGRIAVDETIANKSSLNVVHRASASSDPLPAGSRRAAASADWHPAPSTRNTERRNSRPDRNPRGRPPHGSHVRRRRHLDASPSSPNSSTLLTARSMATHAMTFEWVNCRWGPRTSQMPSSGLCQSLSRKSRSAALYSPRVLARRQS